MMVAYCAAATQKIARRMPAIWAITAAIALFSFQAARSEETPPTAPSEHAPTPNEEPPPAPAAVPKPTAPMPAPPASTLVIDGPELEGVLGKETLSRKGEKMGQIVDILADRNGELRAAIIDFGGFLGVGSRKIAVDWRAVHFVPGNKSVRIVLDLTREEVTGSHEYKPGDPVAILQPTPATPTPPK